MVRLTDTFLAKLSYRIYRNVGFCLACYSSLTVIPDDVFISMIITLSFQDSGVIKLTFGYLNDNWGTAG